jgi:crotonobetainyl-CoA:carnitine CoA-transferase CaiB-like acyl-CoA transferase
MKRALENLKILDFSTLLPGPFATMNLGDLGAEVLRVTTTTRVDLLEVLPPLLSEKNYSATGAQINRNKRTLTLNLHEPKAIAIIKKLILEYDIIVEQFRPGVMKKLGLDYETLSQINPKLIYCSITGYGQGNSMSHRAGHDINYLSLGGVSGYSGRKGEAPSLNGIQIADIAGGSYNAIIGILTAVIHRLNSGEGSYVDTSMTDGMIAFHAIWGPGCLQTEEAPQPEETLLNGGTLYDYYETKDGKYFSYGGLEPKFWESFCKHLHREEWIPLGVSGAGSEIKEEIKKILLSKTYEEWTDIMKDADACFEPVLTLSEVFQSQLVKEREMVVQVPDGDSGMLKQIGSPYKLSATPPRYDHAGKPASPEETESILLELGYSPIEVAEMSKAGVLK